MRLGVDTSVLLRLFLKDDADQLAAVRAMIERVAAADGVLYVAQAVVCELVWVLTIKARFTRDQIAKAVQGLVETAMIELEGHDTVCAALERHATSNVGFADCLIVENVLAAGAARLATFDKRLLRSDDCVAPIVV